MTDKEKAKALDIIMDKFGLSLDRLWLYRRLARRHKKVFKGTN